jgi:hypothetical protein
MRWNQLDPAVLTPYLNELQTRHLKSFSKLSTDA